MSIFGPLIVIAVVGAVWGLTYVLFGFFRKD
jgi:hypothetical protein